MMTELRTAARALRAWKLGTLGAVATLALGIGAASSMYVLVAALLGAGAPRLDDLSSLGRVYASNRSLSVERSPLPLTALGEVAALPPFHAAGASVGGEAVLGHGSGASRIALHKVSGGFFRALRLEPVAGRLFTRDEAAGAADVVVVSERLWRSRLARSAPGTLRVTIDDVPRTVVGVLPDGFGGALLGIDGDAWVPLRTEEAIQARAPIFVRLKAGASWADAASALQSIERSAAGGGAWTLTAIPVEADRRLRAGQGTFFVFGPALVVLLIACTNVACMLLARGFAREAELGVRAALGASRGRLIRQLTVEHALLAAAGALLGFGVARLALGAVTAFLAQLPALAALEEVTSSLPTLAGAAAGFSALACLLFGVVPAMRLSRRDVAGWLRGATPSATARVRGYGARDLVVFVELGCAVTLVVTTALFVRFFAELTEVSPNYAAAELIVVDAAAARAERIADGVRALPGVASVSLATEVPGRERPSSLALVTSADGRTARATLVGARESVFRTLGLALRRGRTFDAGERASREVAVVSETLAARLWPGADPLGARVSLNVAGLESRVIVIGVSQDAVEGGGLLRTGLLPPDLYVPYAPDPGARVRVIARAAADAHLLVRPIATLGTPEDGGALRPEVMADEASRTRPDGRFVVGLLGGLGLVALLLAASGIVGVVSQSVAQRTPEFGVRLALGATPRSLLGMVVARESRLMLAAVGTGLAGTLLVARSTFVELLPIVGSDARVWIGVAVLCGGTAAVALVAATWRLVRLDPLVVLRQL